MMDAEEALLGEEEALLDEEEALDEDEEEEARLVSLEEALVGEEVDAWTCCLEDLYVLHTPDEPDWVRPKYIIENEKKKIDERTPNEEYLMINQQIKDSEGFDIDWSQNRCLFNYHPVELNDDEFVDEEMVDEPETNLDLLNRLCKKSIDHYNQENKTAYEFFKTVKANFHGQIGIMFLITFQVKDPVDNLTKEFQTRIHYSYVSKSQFVFCRPKSDGEASTDEDSVGVAVSTDEDSLGDAENDLKKPRLE